MGTGKHRAISPRRQKIGSMVVAGAVPVVLTLVGSGTADAEPDQYIPASRTDHAASIADDADSPGAAVTPAAQDEAKQWPAVEVPNVRPYLGRRIPDDTLTSLQWARPIPKAEYLAPLEALHAPVAVTPVPPIAPPPGKLRFGDVQVESPEWLPKEQAIQINDGAAIGEANIATFLDSVGMERTRSDRVASQTLGAAAIGATAGAAFASPFALIGAGVGGGLGLAIGMPFAPIGLAAAPLGAAYGAALMAAPLAAIGAGIGAGIGATAALAAPPRAIAVVSDAAAGADETVNG